MQPEDHSSRVRIGRAVFASGPRRSSRYSLGGRVLARPTTLEFFDKIGQYRGVPRHDPSGLHAAPPASSYAPTSRQKMAAPRGRPAIRRETDRRSSGEEEDNSSEEIGYVPKDDRRDDETPRFESRRQQVVPFLSEDDRLDYHFHPGIRSHRSLAFFGDVDRDLRCVLDALLFLSDYYARLKNDSFLNERIYEEIAAASDRHQLAYVGAIKLRLSLALIQHLCARLRTRPLRQQIINGLTVLYHYHFYYVHERAEEKIFEQLNAFTSEEVDDDMLTVFRNSSSSDQQEPRRVLLVPWTDCLGLVRRKEVLLRNGKAYVNYTQAAEWAVQKWTSGFEHWIQHDYQITAVLVDDHLSSIGGEKTQREFRAYRQKMMRDLEIVLLRDHFFSSTTTLSCDFDARRFLQPIYVQLFKHAETLMPSQPSSSSSTKTTIVFPRYTNFIDYVQLMPPCILSMYSKAVRARTHFKYADRFPFFTWAFKVGVPLEVLNVAWAMMCEQDADAVRQGKIASLLREPASIYEKHEQSQTGVGMHGCTAMQKLNHCSFVVDDIEDLGSARQLKCIGSVCGTSSNWSQYAVNWSPMAASRFKAKQK